MEDKELSLIIDLFLNNLIASTDVDNVVMITNRGDRVGIHTNGNGGPSEAVAFAMLEKVVENKKAFMAAKNLNK